MSSKSETPGDFTTTARVIPISLLAIVIGVLSSGVAWALLKLIGLFTNLFYYQRWSSAMVSPAGNHLGVLAIFVPVAGALIIGLMARYGSERIRGHGIPEAIESILINGSRVQPRLAILKPLGACFIRRTGRMASGCIL
jgi:chloride channel protein, CIC family